MNGLNGRPGTDGREGYVGSVAFKWVDLHEHRVIQCSGTRYNVVIEWVM